MDRLINILTPAMEEFAVTQSAGPVLSKPAYDIRRAFIDESLRRLVNIIKANHYDVVTDVINEAPKKWSMAPYGYPYRFLIYCWPRLPHTAYIYLTRILALCILRSRLDAQQDYSIDYND